MDRGLGRLALGSALALAAANENQGLQVVYNNRSTGSSVGAALDGNLANNGLTRKKASYSTVALTLTGTPGQQINNGVASDGTNRWDLPASCIIGSNGSLTITATCETIGAITAMAGTITLIATPMGGWTAVTNAAAASVGQPVEADSQAKGRQATSVALPSKTRTDAVRAAIAAQPNVTRSIVYENVTAVTDANGMGSHSIGAVVEGGADADIANTIYIEKGPGCGVNGTSSVAIS